MDVDPFALCPNAPRTHCETNDLLTNYCSPSADPSEFVMGDDDKLSETQAVPVKAAQNANVSDDDDAESIILSPPPESLDDSEMNGLGEDPEDEIVVGSVKGKLATSNKTAALSASKRNGNADRMDLDNDDAEEDKDIEEVEMELQQRPKRKRASFYEDLAEDSFDKSMLDEADDIGTPVPGSAVAKGAPLEKSSNKSVVLGYWRDSDAPEPNQHAVKGFIDSRDRLRTRIQNHNREGKIVTGTYPLKPGPGGSWVTFHNIVFNEHLINLDQHQVKEYVKIRCEMVAKGPEVDSSANDKLAVQQAIKACQARGPPPENALPPLIAYGPTIPEHARISYSRAEKKRRTANASSTPMTPDVQMPYVSHQPPLQAAPPVLAPTLQSMPPQQPMPPPDLPGKRPTKILLGYWLESAEPNMADKHAVFGILGSNDMFRVKVGKETRDGRPMQSNFPQGAGALWINAHQWEREDYLTDLSRDEIKEYCRVRQYQIDSGETEADYMKNRTNAIAEARRRAAFLPNKGKVNGMPVNTHFTDAVLMHEVPNNDARHNIARRPGPAITPATSSRQSPQTPGFRAANRSGVDTDHRLERANNLAMHAVSRIEANQAKVEERDAYPPAPQVLNGHDSFRESIGRLNNVWSSQEAHRIRLGNEDAKIYGGVKYERKRNGPFAGKLVSQGAIISIDGEDYVEYRVLTKPTFI